VIICISTPVAKMFNNKKVKVIYNCVNLSRYPKFSKIDEIEKIKYEFSKNIRNEFSINTNSYVVGTVGRIVPRKGYEYFIKAARIVLNELNNVVFMIVGDVDNKTYIKYKNYLLSLIKEFKLEKKFILPGFRDDIPQIMALFDCFVLPSHSEKSPEPFGRVIIEAMAAATPVIATDEGGVIDIITHGETGILIPGGDEKPLAEAINKILKNKHLGYYLGYKGRKKVEEFFTIEKSIEEIQRIYESILA
jgi:glycosyltransferase involved in cell wall biosynthesis